MSDTKVVYRSTHPDVLTHCDAVKAAHEAWPERMKTALAGWSVPEAKTAHLTHHGSPSGFDYPAELDIPHGWRRDQRRGWLVPAKTTTRGKAIAKEMGALVRPELRENLPGGMPPASITDQYLLRPVVERIGDQVFAAWSGEPFAGDMRHVDPEIWERIKLSEYYAVIEAAATPEQGATPC